jgi:hypothetical protein
MRIYRSGWNKIYFEIAIEGINNYILRTLLNFFKVLTDDFTGKGANQEDFLE